MNAATVSGPSRGISSSSSAASRVAKSSSLSPSLREAVMMRAARVQHARDRQVEVEVIVRQAGERGGRDGHAVIGLHAADDLLLVRRPSALFMYQTSFIWLSLASEPELQKNTFEIGTGAISFSFSASSIAGSWLLRGEQMRERELAHLRGGGLDQFLIVVAERRAPQARHAFEIRPCRRCRRCRRPCRARSPAGRCRGSSPGWCRGGSGSRPRGSADCERGHGCFRCER